MEALSANMEITPWTYLVLTTRGVNLDVDGLPDLLDSKAAYIGVIGSRRRWTTTWKQLVERGIEEEKLRRVHSPIGLELNAETPEEIAVSIMAEIIMLRNGGDGSEMKLKGELRAGTEKPGE
jgi:xanthine dehydrogenase accessory factor